MNIELLQKVRDMIANTKEGVGTQFDMRFCFVKKSRTLRSTHSARLVYNTDDGGFLEEWYPHLFGECGTAGCIAGFAMAAQNYRGVDWDRIEADLEITGSDASYLFYGYWHPNYQKCSMDSGMSFSDFLSSITREDVLNYLDLCIKEGEIVHL